MLQCSSFEQNLQNTFSKIGPFQKKSKQGGFRTYFFEKKPPRMSRFVTLSLEIPDNQKLHPWKFHKIATDPLKIPKPKTKTHDFT